MPRAAWLVLVLLAVAGGLVLLTTQPPETRRDGEAGAASDVGPSDAHPEPGERARVQQPVRADGASATDSESGVVAHVCVLTAADDEPVAGARVTLLRGRTRLDWFSDGDPPTPEDELTPAAVAVTDAAGLASLPGAGARCSILRVEAEGFATVLAGHAPGESSDETWTGTTVHLWPARAFALHVVDEDDAPVTSCVAHVHSESDLPALESVPADANGVVAFVAGDGAQVRIEAPGYASSWIEDLVQWGDAWVVLRPALSIEGVVVGGDGEPVEGASVLGTDCVSITRTDADGRFRFDGLLPTAGEYEIEAWADGGLHGSAFARPGARDVQIVLPPPIELRGRVLRADGRPAVGAHVRVFGGDSDRTDEEGGFVIIAVPGAHRLVARVHESGAGTRGEAGVADVVVSDGGPGGDVEIRMETVPSSFVYVRVQTADGTRFRGYGMMYDDAHERGFGRHHGTTPVGEWTELSVPVGTPVELSFTTARDDDVADAFQAVVATRARVEGDPDVVRAPAAGHAWVELTLTTVRTDGAAIPDDADVNWRAGRDIATRVTGLPAGSPPTGVVRVPRGQSATVLAWADGCGTLELKVPATDAPTARFECRLPPEALVRGRLVTRSGRPYTRAHVEVLVTCPDGTESLSVASFDQLLPGGVFVADQLAGGQGRITVKDDGRRIVAEQTFDVPAGGTTDLGDVVVGALPRARGTVTVAGRPVAGAGVSAHDGDAFLAEGSTDADGTLDLAVPLRPGATLLVEHDDVRVRYVLEDVVAMSPVGLRADPTGEIAFEWSRWDLLGDGIELRLPGGPRLPSGTLRLDDYWTFPALPAGRIDVTIRPRSGGVRRASAEVVPGKTTKVDLASGR